MAEQAAASFLSKISRPCLKKVLLASHTSGGFWLGGLDTLRKSLPTDKKQVAFEYHGEHWPVVYIPTAGGFSGGWRSFAVDNGLVIGDAIVFEVIEDARLKMYIFRVKDYASGNGPLPDIYEDAAQINFNGRKDINVVEGRTLCRVKEEKEEGSVGVGAVKVKKESKDKLTAVGSKKRKKSERCDKDTDKLQSAVSNKRKKIEGKSGDGKPKAKKKAKQSGRSAADQDEDADNDDSGVEADGVQLAGSGTSPAGSPLAQLARLQMAAKARKSSDKSDSVPSKAQKGAGKAAKVCSKAVRGSDKGSAKAKGSDKGTPKNSDKAAGKVGRVVGKVDGKETSKVKSLLDILSDSAQKAARLSQQQQEGVAEPAAAVVVAAASAVVVAAAADAKKGLHDSDDSGEDRGGALEDEGQMDGDGDDAEVMAAMCQEQQADKGPSCFGVDGSSPHAGSDAKRRSAARAGALKDNAPCGPEAKEEPVATDPSSVRPLQGLKKSKAGNSPKNDSKRLSKAGSGAKHDFGAEPEFTMKPCEVLRELLAQQAKLNKGCVTVNSKTRHVSNAPAGLSFKGSRTCAWSLDKTYGYKLMPLMDEMNQQVVLKS